MKTRKAAKLASLTVKTVRNYVDIQVAKPEKNYDSTYRNFSKDDVAKLQVFGKARKFGFTIQEYRELLALYEDTIRPSREVKSLALEKIAEINQKLNELKDLRSQLAILVAACRGDDRPECPILDTLSATTRQKPISVSAAKNDEQSSLQEECAEGRNLTYTS